jgi:hypothetical protein
MWDLASDECRRVAATQTTKDLEPDWVLLFVQMHVGIESVCFADVTAVFCPKNNRYVINYTQIVISKDGCSYPTWGSHTCILKY